MHAAWMTHRSMTADPSVKQQKLKAGTVSESLPLQNLIDSVSGYFYSLLLLMLP